MERERYLDLDGVAVAARIAGALVLPLLLATAFSLARADARGAGGVRLRICLLSVWLYCLTAVATRAALVTIVIMTVALAYRARSRWLRVGVAVVGVGLLLSAAQLVHEGRFRTHGLLPLAQQTLSGDVVGTLRPDNLRASVKGLVASASASFPTTALTMYRTAPPDVFHRLINPLPRSLLMPQTRAGLEVDEHTYEVVQPFVVVPTTAVGELHGQGPVVAAAFFGLTGVALRILATGRGRARRLVAYGLSGLLLLTAIQYPARQYARILELALVLATGTLLLADTARPRIRRFVGQLP